jgi:hypothetical protein
MADDDEGMDLNEMEGEEDEGSAEEEGDDNDDDIDLDAEEEEGEAEGGQQDGITSPAGSVEMMQEDSNSMDVGMMQSSARLY